MNWTVRRPRNMFLALALIAVSASYAAPAHSQAAPPPDGPAGLERGQVRRRPVEVLGPGAPPSARPSASRSAIPRGWSSG